VPGSPTQLLAFRAIIVPSRDNKNAAGTTTGVKGREGADCWLYIVCNKGLQARSRHLAPLRRLYMAFGTQLAGDPVAHLGAAREMTDTSPRVLPAKAKSESP
jgi:hypothetical protein